MKRCGCQHGKSRQLGELDSRRRTVCFELPDSFGADGRQPGYGNGGDAASSLPFNDPIAAPIPSPTWGSGAPPFTVDATQGWLAASMPTPTATSPLGYTPPGSSAIQPMSIFLRYGAGSVAPVAQTASGAVSPSLISFGAGSTLAVGSGGNQTPPPYTIPTTTRK